MGRLSRRKDNARKRWAHRDPIHTQRERDKCRASTLVRYLSVETDLPY